MANRPVNDEQRRPGPQGRFEVFTFDRNFSNKERRSTSPHRLVLVSVDRDYLPIVESLAKRTIPTAVVFWEHATAVDLRAKVDDYSDLELLFDHLTRKPR